MTCLMVPPISAGLRSACSVWGHQHEQRDESRHGGTIKRRAERRAPSAERRAPSAERRAPSAERRAPSAERRAPSAERRAPSAERRAPSAERRAPSAMKCARLPAGAQPPAASTPSRPPSSRPTPPRDRSRPDPRGGRARLSLLLPVLALLLGAVDLLTAAPADARTTREPVVTPIWSATLTVDVGNNQYGCSGHPSHTACSTNLTDNDFTYNGVGYEVQDLFLHSGHILVFRLNGETGHSMQEEIGPLTLNVGGSTFAIRDAVAATQLTWNNTGLRWTDGQTVPVSLTRVVPAGVPRSPGASG